MSHGWRGILHDRELIDTLWNVNQNLRRTRDGCCFELIDTLWNVNLDVAALYRYAVSRINRYIMECKFELLFWCWFYELN